jgi:hypothetical protein
MKKAAKLRSVPGHAFRSAGRLQSSPPIKKTPLPALRNYGKQKCPGALRKQPMARGEGPLVTLSTCPRAHGAPKALRNYGKPKIPVFLMGGQTVVRGESGKRMT